MTLPELLAHIKQGNWDWPDGDHAWLSSQSGIHRVEPDGSLVAIFFIHGGRIRHQAHLPFRRYTLAEFLDKVRALADGLDDPHVIWSNDSGDGDTSLWIEGTRLPNESDVARLNAAKEAQDQMDRINLQQIKKRLKIE